MKYVTLLLQVGVLYVFSLAGTWIQGSIPSVDARKFNRDVNICFYSFLLVFFH